MKSIIFISIPFSGIQSYKLNSRHIIIHHLKAISAFYMFLDDENLYNDPKKTYPKTSTKRDIIKCFFNFIIQYKKNKTLSNIKDGTPKLSTDRTENILGGKKGKI